MSRTGRYGAKQSGGLFWGAFSRAMRDCDLLDNEEDEDLDKYKVAIFSGRSNSTTRKAAAVFIYRSGLLM